MLRLRRGFTLWEMSMVLLIMAVTAVLVVPAFARLGADKPKDDAAALMAVLHDARKAAIDRNATVVLRIDPLSGRYEADTTGASGAGALAAGILDFGLTEQLVTDLPRLQYVFRPTGAAFADSVLVRGATKMLLVSVDLWSGVAHADAR
jgi:prepilin-type N-terminal cleavage/methylation domain-containing protein